MKCRTVAHLEVDTDCCSCRIRVEFIITISHKYWEEMSEIYSAQIFIFGGVYGKLQKPSVTDKDDAVDVFAPLLSDVKMFDVLGCLLGEAGAADHEYS